MAEKRKMWYECYNIVNSAKISCAQSTCEKKESIKIQESLSEFVMNARTNIYFKNI